MSAASNIPSVPSAGTSSERPPANPAWTIRFLDPEDFGQLDPLFAAQGAPPLDPNFSKVVVATSPNQAGQPEVVGIMVLQMVPHAEPIVVREDFQGTGLWRDLASTMDGYLSALQIPGVYTQPVHGTSEAICRKMGFEPAAHPLWVKLYNPQFEQLMPELTL